MGQSASRKSGRNKTGGTPLRIAELMLSRVIAARHVWPTLTQMRVGLALDDALPLRVIEAERVVVGK